MKKIELTTKDGVKISINISHIVYFAGTQRPDFTYLKLLEEKAIAYPITYEELAKKIEEAK